MQDFVSGSGFEGLRLFQLVSIRFRLLSVVTSWFGLCHVAAVVLTSVGRFKLFSFCV